MPGVEDARRGYGVAEAGLIVVSLLSSSGPG